MITILFKIHVHRLQYREGYLFAYLLIINGEGSVHLLKYGLESLDTLLQLHNASLISTLLSQDIICDKF